MKKKNQYGVLGLILLSIFIPIALRLFVPIGYPFYWTLLIIPAVLVPNWKAASIILLTLTGIEFGVEWWSYQGQIPDELLLFLVGSTAVNWLVFLIFTYVHIQNQKINQQLYKQAMIDPLTEAYNRRFYEGYVKKIPDLLSKADQPSFVMYILDIDRYLKITEMYGNLFGDEVVRQVAQVIKQTIRPSDKLVRLNGEQFVVFMPGIDKSAAEELAKQIHHHIGENRFIHKEQPVYVTISLGMAVYQSNEKIEEWLDRADNALYQAKISGRNRIYIAS